VTGPEARVGPIGDRERAGRAGVSGKRLAIVQSNYIPWKGYFDLINSVDEFVLFDDVQYTRQDWRNRNRIKTRDGVRWLTVPVVVGGRYQQTIRETRVSDHGWPRRHWETIRHSYSRARRFRDHADLVADAYARCRFAFLSEVNRHFLEVVCGALGIRTTLSSSADYRLEGGRTERLVGLCRQAGASEYVSGPSARAYLDERLFDAAGIRVRHMDYAGYPEYPQLFPPFEHAVTVLDLMFNLGREAPRYLKSFVGRDAAGSDADGG
jgi:hypothetical protein